MSMVQWVGLWLVKVQNFQNPKLLKIKSSLQYHTVLGDILVKNELCIPLERGSNVLSTGESFICLSPPSKLFCSIYK